MESGDDYCATHRVILIHTFMFVVFQWCMCVCCACGAFGAYKDCGGGKDAWEVVVWDMNVGTPYLGLRHNFMHVASNPCTRC